MQDLQSTVEMLNLSSRRLYGSDEFEAQDFSVDWQLPRFDLETNTCLVLAADGTIAGYCEFWDLYEPHVRYYAWLRLHPDYEHSQAGDYLLGWVSRQAAQAINRAPAGARVVVQAHVLHIDQAAGELFRRSGFDLIRHSLRMTITLNGTPPVPQLPEGISIRTMRVGQDEVETVRAIRAAFKDHWGYVETPFEEDLARWKHYIENNEKFDANLWFLAVDGDEIAGVSLCWPEADNNTNIGWVGTLGVRRPWRKRGLGLALLQHSFREFHRRGKVSVGLGVDAQSLTGATRLYLKAGMQPDSAHQFDLYELELSQGTDLSTKSIETA
jgi:GNAT superfamily N-acetyltransferase